MGKKSELKLAREKVNEALKKVNDKIEELGAQTSNLYENLNRMQALFDHIRNMPIEQKLKYEKLKTIRLSWKNQADKIESDYEAAFKGGIKKGAAGASAGIAMAALGPTAAMGVATTFGVASKVGLEALDEGLGVTVDGIDVVALAAEDVEADEVEIAAGGGGMIAGEAFLAMFGPLGWAIAGVAAVTSGILLIKNKKDQTKLEGIYTLVAKRDTKSYDLAAVELDERIVRIQNESRMLTDATSSILTFGQDYEKMTEAQQYALGSYVNLMEASTQLLVNPILGLQAKYTESDFDQFMSSTSGKGFSYTYIHQYKDAIISLSNLLYGINLHDDEERLLAHTLRKNKEFLQSVHLEKDSVDSTLFKTVSSCLNYKYANQ